MSNNDDNPILVVLTGDLSGEQFSLGDREFTIGRSRSCDIRIPKLSVSRVHAVISCQPDGRWLLTDQRSSNGTLVNEQSVEQHYLADGDMIDIASELRLRFRAFERAKSTERPLSIVDVAKYAIELDATIRLPNFIAWLRENRENLETMDPNEIESIARECLYEFAYLPEREDLSSGGDPDHV
jgi:pSer/pThr/pTyr-binding forkhead associated (FHA) protein